MNDRQRLEAIVAIVCRYLPPDGISREEAMSQIISLVDPLPEQEPWDTSDMAYRPNGLTVEQAEKQIPTTLCGPNLEQTLNAAGFYRQRIWVGLTDEEFNECLVEGDPCEALAEPEAWEVMRSVEAKLKERNT